MSRREQAEESFRKLQQEIKKTIFLKDASQSDNTYARALLDIAYDFMEELGWPDHEWSINTTLNGTYRPFYEAARRGLGIVVTATILEKPLTIALAINSAERIVLNDRPIADLVQKNGRMVPSDEFFPAAKAALITEAVKALSTP